MMTGKYAFGNKLLVAVCVTIVWMGSWWLPAAAHAYTYQIDSGTPNGECCFQNSLYGEAEDSWVGNTFTAVPNYTRITSITWQAGVQMSSLPAGGNVTYAIYSGTPTSGLTLLESTSLPYAGIADGQLVTQTLPTAVNLTPGQNFTAALLIENTPGGPTFGQASFPFTIDNSNSSTNGSQGSYYDIVSTLSSPYGTVNAYTIGSPYFPVLNGANYIFADGSNSNSTNAFAGIAFSHNAVYTPEPSSLILAGIAGALAIGYGVRRRRNA